jgi:hypothetical protein
MTWLMLSMEGEKKQDNKLTILYWERLCVRTMAGCQNGRCGRQAGGHRPPNSSGARGWRSWSITRSLNIHFLMNPLVNLPGIQLRMYPLVDKSIFTGVPK